MPMNKIEQKQFVDFVLSCLSEKPYQVNYEVENQTLLIRMVFHLSQHDYAIQTETPLHTIEFYVAAPAVIRMIELQLQKYKEKY